VNKQIRISLITAALTGLMIISACGMVERVLPTAESTISPESTASPSLIPAPTSTSISTGQQPALLENFQSDLSRLENLPFYNLTLALDPERAAYQGSLKLRFTNLEETALDSLHFRLFPNGGKSYGNGALEVNAVTSGGQSLETALTLNDSVLEVVLQEPAAPGETKEIAMEFSGEIPVNFQGGGYGIFNASEDVVVLSGWFPLLAVYDDEGWNLDPVSGIGDSVYSDMAYFDVWVSAPAGWELIGTGFQINPEDPQDLEVGRLFISGPARDFLLVAGTEYNLVSGEYQGVTVNSYFLPGDRAGGERALRVTGGSLEIFNELFGSYPYRELDVIEIPMRYAAGVEFPGVSLLGESIYDSPGSTWFATVAAHEAAHQWWYHLVGSDVINEPWLDEALTTYSSLLYFEDVYGEQAYQQMLTYYREVYQSAVERNNDHPVVEDLAYFEDSPSRRSAYSPIVYSKGAVFFHELREQIGEEAFFAALREYYRDNRYRIGTPEELLGSFEEEAGQELESLYQQWLYSSASE